MTQASLSPISALIAHLEPVINDRRILVIGNARRSVAEHLLERGARLVQVLDPDPRRVAHAAAHNSERRVTYAQLTDNSLRDGSYDCVLVEDAELAFDLDSLARGASRSLGQTGVAVICIRNDQGTTGLLGTVPGTMDYDSLCDAVDEHFESNIILGQTAFLGYSVVQFGLENPPEPALDNAYLGQSAEQPDFYIALAGSEETLGELELEDMTIVQLPSSRFVAENVSSERDWGRRAARRAEALETELSSLRKRSDDAEVERLTRELEQRDAWIRELESRSESADARADDAQAQADELEQELSDMRVVLEATRQDADRAVAERDQALSELDDAKRKLDEAGQAPSPLASSDSALLEEELDDLREELEDMGMLLSKRTQALSESRARVVSLETELADAIEAAKEGEHHSVGRQALEQEVTLLDEKNRELTAKLADKTRGLERLERRLVEHEKELDDLHEQLDETEDLLSQARTELTENSGPTREELERDVRGLEEQLRERGHRILELESQLRKLEAYAKTLKVEVQGVPQPEDDGTRELDLLSRALAEREADLVAAEWKIGQLEQASSRD